MATFFQLVGKSSPSGGGSVRESYPKCHDHPGLDYTKKLPKLHYILDIVGYTLLGRSSQLDNTHRSGQLPGFRFDYNNVPRCRQAH